MSSILLNGPALEPVTLAEAKAWLRVEHDDDDDAIGALIAGARLHVEARTRRALIAQSWRLVRDRWPANGRIALRPAPVTALDAVRVYDGEDVAHTLDLQGFVLDVAGSALAFPPFAPAAPGRSAAGIEIDLTAGYGDVADDVPQPLRQAILMLVAHWYENRGVTAASGAVALLPANVATLIAPYRMVTL
jgi:uncharacterized phiE125 gp8 family phage protein